MLHRLAVPALVALLLAAPLPAAAETAPPAGAVAEVAGLTETLRIPDTFAVFVEEGLVYGASIEEQMFPGRGGARWSALVAAIYDAPALQASFETALAEALAGDTETVTAAIAFFGQARGQEILKLEIEGRRALLDEAVEEAARVEAEEMIAARDRRLGLIRDLVEASDLVEMNVAGALTANLAFFQGMQSVGVPGMAMDDEQMMTEVWAQEAAIRDETSKWLYSYLAMAYRPLADEDLQAYVAFSESPQGKRLNAAMFAAFDRVFRDVSFRLGQSAALILQGDDI